MLDVAEYGGRVARAKKRVQQRLVELISLALDDLNIPLMNTDGQGTGDGALVFLPEGINLRQVLPTLLHSTAIHLAANNADFQDQLQLRMAVDIGLVGLAPLGFSGATATNLGRLVNAEPLRNWLTGSPSRDLATVISDRLHSLVITEDVPRLPQAHFRRISVQVKEFTTDAWLWTEGSEGSAY